MCQAGCQGQGQDSAGAEMGAVFMWEKGVLCPGSNSFSVLTFSRIMS